MNVTGVKKIAVVGATTNPQKFGNIILKDLRRKKFDLVPVTPRYDEVDGLRTCRDVTELPRDVDLIVFVVPPEVGISEVRRAYDAGFRRFWFQPGAESEEIVRFSREHPDAEFSFFRCIMVETNR